MEGLNKENYWDQIINLTIGGLISADANYSVETIESNIKNLEFLKKNKKEAALKPHQEKAIEEGLEILKRELNEFQTKN